MVPYPLYLSPAFLLGDKTKRQASTDTCPYLKFIRITILPLDKGPTVPQNELNNLLLKSALKSGMYQKVGAGNSSMFMRSRL